MSPGSIMPAYDWLLSQTLNSSNTKDKLKAMKTLGVPYDEYAIEHADEDLKVQAKGIADNLAKEGIKVAPDKEIIALIAYLQRIGTDIKKGQQ
jgi:cytochrome c oxidase cbb3-type subunit I/II